jgi:hypothetical protein
LARAVFIHRLGEIRDRTYEDQQHRASGLNLLVTAIILWNTRYLDRATTALRAVEESPKKFSSICPRSAGSTSISQATVSGRRPTERRKTLTDTDPSGPLPMPPSWLHEFAICPLMLQKWTVR